MSDHDPQKRPPAHAAKPESDDAATRGSPFATRRLKEDFSEAELFAFVRQKDRGSAEVSQPAKAPAAAPVQPRSINDALAALLVLFLAMSPIPVGSNRPVFWLTGAAIVFFICAIYLVVLGRRNLRLRVPPTRTPILSIAALGFVAFALLQVIPLPGVTLVLPGGISRPDDVPFAISLARDATLIAAIRWASYAIFFFLMLQVVDNRARARTLAWAIFLVIAAHAAWALVSFRFFGDAFFWGDPSQYSGVVTGTFINRNSFATFAGFGAILGFALFLQRVLRDRENLSRLAGLLSFDGLILAGAWALIVLILAAVIATGSRMGVTGTFAGLLAVTALTLSKHRGGTRGVVTAIIASQMIGVLVLLWVFGRTVLERAIFFAPDGLNRAELYQQTLDLILTRPWLGFGLDAYQLAFELVHRPPVSPDLVWGRAHSTYLALWVEMGVVFGSLPLLILAVIAWSMARAVRARSKDYVLAIAGIGVLVLGGLHSLVDFSLEMPANVYVFLAILALGCVPAARGGK